MKKFIAMAVFLILGAMLFAGTLDGKVIVIDPGHGGPKDRGAVTKDGLEEAVINLKVALYLREMLEKEGALVVMTRTTDVHVPLQRRAEIANMLNADLFVCIHHNYMGTNPKADFSIVYYNANSMDYSINFAYLLSKEFQKYVGTTPGDVGPGDVYVMRSLKIPGILGEPCMMSNKERESWLRKDENLKKEAKAYKNAIVKLFSLKIPKLSFDSTQVNEKFEIISSLPLKEAGAFFGHAQLSAKIEGDGKRIIIEVPKNIKPDEYDLFVYGKSKEGVYTFPLRKEVLYQPEANKVKVEILPKKAPKLAGSFYQITYKLFHYDVSLSYTPRVKVEGSVAAVYGDKVIIPYMGKDDVTVVITSGKAQKKISLKFEGQRPVMGLILKDENGKIVKVLDYRGGEKKIEIQGFKPIIVNEKLKEPVSFKEIVLKKTLSGIFAGKTVAIAYEEETEFVKSLKEKLLSLGATVIEKQVKNMRDNFKAARLFNSKADVVVIFGKMERLEKFLKVPYVQVKEENIDDVIEILSKKLQ